MSAEWYVAHLRAEVAIELVNYLNDALFLLCLRCVRLLERGLAHARREADTLSRRKNKHEELR